MAQYATLFIIAFLAVIVIAENGLGKSPFGISRPKRSSLAYQFSAGIESVVGEVRETFSCTNRAYGYYADVENNCQIFHQCVPPEQQFSFFCPNTTIFDQRLLVCQDLYAATPCQYAEQFYVVNQNFGVIDEEKLVRV